MEKIRIFLAVAVCFFAGLSQAKDRDSCLKVYAIVKDTSISLKDQCAQILYVHFENCGSKIISLDKIDFGYDYMPGTNLYFILLDEKLRKVDISDPTDISGIPDRNVKITPHDEEVQLFHFCRIFPVRKTGHYILRGYFLSTTGYGKKKKKIKMVMPDIHITVTE
ncbi:MAG: hypothetical protein JSS82_08920 [Bacteroidetes bacterium]|nr:hypothetical protein [Bacteroidota bacterium]